MKTHELSDTICTLPNPSYEHVMDPDDKYIINIDERDNLHRIDPYSGERTHIKSAFEGIRLMFNVACYKSSKHPNSLIGTSCGKGGLVVVDCETCLKLVRIELDGGKEHILSSEMI